MYANDVLLHSDATPNEPKYTHLAKYVLQTYPHSWYIH